MAICVEGLHEALAPFGRPGIFNTAQGSQFTSVDFTDVLRGAQVHISMDGRGRWMDSVFIERLWHSLKYQCVYMHAFETGFELRAGLTRWIGHYPARRPPIRPWLGARPTRRMGSTDWRPDDNRN